MDAANISNQRITALFRMALTMPWSVVVTISMSGTMAVAMGSPKMSFS